MSHVHIDPERCKACGLCVAACPHNLLEPSEIPNSRGRRPTRPVVGDVKKCPGCGNCYIVCPDAAIEIRNDEEEGAS